MRGLALERDALRIPHERTAAERAANLPGKVSR
jgi:hypothetical protein